MKFYNNRVEDLKIAYVGGGSRGWAWGLMSDLVSAEDLSGTMKLYDIDQEAAEANVIIGNKFNAVKGAKSHWDYEATDTLEEALTGADFVIISILPGTFDEMESDVHAPEKYGIYQSVGDSIGPGGIIRALRTLPMFEVIAEGIKKCCPSAWVINYTNPLTLCVAQLYQTFPEIHAFGCCHEVFGTQKLLASMVELKTGIKGIRREDIKVNVVGVNHFTWLTEASYQGEDLYPMYREFCEEYADKGFDEGKDVNWMNSSFASEQMVKMDLFLKTGVIAAAGDRHLAEFCPGHWYLKDPEQVKSKHFGLTPVSWRKNQLKERLQKSADMVSGKCDPAIKQTGEDGVNQIRALLGLEDMVTNVNVPNHGQIPNLPIGAVVETNALFRKNSLRPIYAGELPSTISGLVNRISNEQLLILDAVRSRDLDKAFAAFIADPLVTCTPDEARELFDTMIQNTKAYLSMYF